MQKPSDMGIVYIVHSVSKPENYAFSFSTSPMKTRKEQYTETVKQCLAEGFPIKGKQQQLIALFGDELNWKILKKEVTREKGELFKQQEEQGWIAQFCKGKTATVDKASIALAPTRGAGDNALSRPTVLFDRKLSLGIEGLLGFVRGVV